MITKVNIINKVIDKSTKLPFYLRDRNLFLKTRFTTDVTIVPIVNTEGVPIGKERPEPITSKGFRLPRTGRKVDLRSLYRKPRRRTKGANGRTVCQKRLQDLYPKDHEVPGTIKEVSKLFINILESLLKQNSVYTISTITDMVDQVVDFHNCTIVNHGVIDGTKRFNAIRLYIIRLVEGETPEPLPFVATSKKLRFPKCLWTLQELAYNVITKKCPVSDRILRSLLYLNRLVRDNKKIDIVDLARTFNIDPQKVTEFENYVHSWAIKNEYNNNPDLITRPTIKLVAKGPNNVKKHVSAHKEAIALVASTLFEPFRKLADASGNQRLIKYIEDYAAYPLPPKSTSENNRSRRRKSENRKVRLRVITSVPDKGNKSRVVAISDYWTQVLLKPLMLDVQSLIHKYFDNVNSNLNHAAGFNKLKGNIRPGTKSYDVVSWTDGFPALYQYIVLKTLYGDTFADAWYDLVVMCEWEVAGIKTGPVRYGRGQGMGTNGSFDIATLTDLILLEMLYELYYGISTSETRNFVYEDKILFNKVGDDLWCYDPDNIIFDYYTKVIGLEINLNKTKSANSHSNYVGEYVSRNLNYGQDVSRISANICRAAYENPFGLFEVAKHLLERGVETLIPMDYIKTNRRDYPDIIKALFLYSEMYPSPASMLINKSLKASFRDLFNCDPLLIMFKADLSLLENCKRGAIIHSIFSTLGSIIDKWELLNSDFHQNIDQYEYNGSDPLSEQSIKDRTFKYNDEEFEELNLYTSKYLFVLANTAIKKVKHIAANNYTSVIGDIYNTVLHHIISRGDYAYVPHVLRQSYFWNGPSPTRPSFKEWESVLDSLSRLDAEVNFTGLGVVNTEDVLINQNISRIYTYIKNLKCIQPSLAPYGEEADPGFYVVITPHRYASYEKYRDIFTSLQCLEVPSKDPTVFNYKDFNGLQW